MSMIANMYESFLTLFRAKVKRDSRQGVKYDFTVAGGVQTLVSNVPCSLQHAGFRDLMYYSQRNEEIDGTIHVAQDIGAEPNDLLTITDRTGISQNYRVLGTNQPVGRARVWEVHASILRQPGYVVATNTQGIPS